MTTLHIIQIITSIFLILAILIQNKSSGLSSAITGEAGAIQSTKRGPEKFLFQATIVLAIVFVGLSLASLFIS